MKWSKHLSYLMTKKYGLVEIFPIQQQADQHHVWIEELLLVINVHVTFSANKSASALAKSKLLNIRLTLCWQDDALKRSFRCTKSLGFFASKVPKNERAHLPNPSIKSMTIAEDFSLFSTTTNDGSFPAKK